MKYIPNSTSLWLELNDAIECGLGSANYISKERSRGAKWGKFMDDPDDLRRTLIEYETLKPVKKELVDRHYPNIYDEVVKEPIRKMVTRDIKANEFYLSYRFEGNKALPDRHVEEYTVAASWLNMLAKADSNKKEIKKLLNLSITDFWIKVCETIASDKIDLPTSYRRLREKITIYQKGGYPSLIHSSFGTSSNAVKVETEESKALLLELLAHPNQFDDVYICAMYNGWAVKNSHKSISPATVGYWRRKNEPYIKAQREGNGAFNEKYIIQVKGSRPTTPLRLVESDDYWLNYLYKGVDEKGKPNSFKRYISYIVADSFNGLVLGKSYVQAGGPVVEMVRLAYIDAMYYIRSLTGSWHLPFEIKADHWQASTLFPFFKSISKFVPPATGNKHRGYIEQLFGSPLAKRCEKMGGNNYNGNNITARNIGVNMDALRIAVKNRLEVGNPAEQQIEAFFYNMQNMPDIKRTDMNAPSKKAQWLDAWSQLPASEKRQISDLQFLQIFGIKHEPQGRPITITNRGVEPQINGRKYSYDLPDYNGMIQYIGAKVFVYYDPYDMSRVLVTNNKDIRFIARDARLSPRALEDASAGSRTYLNDVLNQKRKLVKMVGDAAMARDMILNADYSVETVLQIGRKELKNEAEQMLIETRSGNYRDDYDYDPLDDM